MLSRRHAILYQFSVRQVHLFVSTSFSLGVVGELLVRQLSNLLLFLHLISERRPFTLTFEDILFFGGRFRRIVNVEFLVVNTGFVLVLLRSELKLNLIHHEILRIPAFVHWDQLIVTESLGGVGTEGVRCAVIVTLHFDVFF